MRTRFAKNYAGCEWPHARRMNHGGAYFFFFFAAFFVAKTLTSLRRSCFRLLHQPLYGLNQHVVLSFERVGADFSEALVALERGRNRRQWGFALDL